MKETITGTRARRSSKIDSIAYRAARAFSVSNTVSTSRICAPPSSSPRTASEYAATISSNVTSLYPESLTSGEIERVLFVGPMLPATNLGLSGVLSEYSSVTFRASLAACRLISYTCDSSPNSDNPNRVEVKVLVVSMSAPASRYPLCVSSTMSG